MIGQMVENNFKDKMNYQGVHIWCFSIHFDLYYGNYSDMYAPCSNITHSSQGHQSKQAVLYK